MRLRPISIPALALLAIASAAMAPRSLAQDTPNRVSESVGFDQNLGKALPAGLAFRDESGRTVRLGDFLGKKPVILTLVYYRCPMLCGKELDSLTRSLKPITPAVGKDFTIVTVSISPDETPDLASAKKANYMKAYGRPDAAQGWHFLTGSPESIAALARAAGFRYTYNPKTKLYAHAAGLVFATPEGVIAKYISGLDYPAKVVQANLEEAAKGHVGRKISSIPLLCYDYDESTGAYTLNILKVVRVLGTATALGLGLYVFLMLRRDRHNLRTPGTAPSPVPSGG